MVAMEVSLLSRAERHEAVHWAYRLFLGREPESEQAISRHADFASFQQLRNRFLKSEEFQSKLDMFIPAASFDLLSPPNPVDHDISPREAARLRAHVERNWTRLGEEMPHWWVLSADVFRPDQIVQNEESFYASGSGDLHRVTATLKRQGLEPGDFPTLFEFGCGLGRATIHLAKEFSKVVACDISPTHLAIAKRRVRQLDLSNIQLLRADADSFGMEDTFDLWFSRIVLQHNPPPIIRLILGRMFSLLSPGGIAIFQVPTYAKNYRFHFDSYLRATDRITDIEMHVLPQGVIFDIAASHGAIPLVVREDDAIGAPGWLSTNFVFRKLPARTARTAGT